MDLDKHVLMSELVRMNDKTIIGFHFSMKLKKQHFQIPIDLFTDTAAILN